MRKLFLILVVIVLSACVEQTTAQVSLGKNVSTKVDETVTLNEIELTVKDIKAANYYIRDYETDKTTLEYSPGYRIEKLKGYKFVLVEIKLNNLADKAKYCGAGKAIIISDGFVYKPLPFISTISYGYLEPGVHEGVLVYKIPENVSKFDLLYDLSDADEKPLTWTVKYEGLSPKLKKISSILFAKIEIGEIRTYMFGSLDFDCTISNTGNVPIEPEIDVEVVHDDEKFLFKSVKLPESLEKIAPGETKSGGLIVKLYKDHHLTPGLYEIVVKLRYKFDKDVIAQDTASVEYTGTFL